MIKVIVFDFDGVIVDSEPIKHSAWLDVFSKKEDDTMSRIMQLVDKYAYGKGSRFDILEEFFKTLGKKKDEIPTLVKKYADKYNIAVQKGIFSQGVTKENYDALEVLSKEYVLYINSATPEIAVKESIEKLGLSHIFTGVYGQPFRKVENLQKIAEEKKASADEILFVGDGRGDYEAALEFKCHFVGITNDWNKWKNKSFILIKSLTLLEEVISELNLPKT